MKIQRHPQNPLLFQSEDGNLQYRFQINGQKARLFANTAERTAKKGGGVAGFCAAKATECIPEAIEEFLFYAGFITTITDETEAILHKRADPCPYLADLSEIQPSQFFINEKKLADCKKWIKSYKDIFIPIVSRAGRLIAQDGHTRMKAALELNFRQIYVYPEEHSSYIFAFADEAISRGITGIKDMPIITNEEYQEKWHKFCEAFFKSHNRNP